MEKLLKRKSNIAEIVNQTVFTVVSFLICCFLAFILAEFFIDKFNGADELNVAGVGLIFWLFFIPVYLIIIPWGSYLLFTAKKNIFVTVGFIAVLALWLLCFLISYIIPY